jgi:hypothetical protein
MTAVEVTCPGGMDPCNSYEVTWTQPNPTGVTIDIYAVRDCLNPPGPSGTTRVCVTPGTVIPNASLYLLGSVPAATGTFTFSLHGGETYGYGWFDDGHYAYAVVVQAVNAVGPSPWVIAGSASKCEDCAL